jgi:hypothetical protein
MSFTVSAHCDIAIKRTLNLYWIVTPGSRLLREQQKLKIPSGVLLAPEEAEALPAESGCPERKSSFYLKVIR